MPREKKTAQGKLKIRVADAVLAGAWQQDPATCRNIADLDLSRYPSILGWLARTQAQPDRRAPLEIMGPPETTRRGVEVERARR